MNGMGDKSERNKEEGGGKDLATFRSKFHHSQDPDFWCQSMLLLLLLLMLMKPLSRCILRVQWLYYRQSEDLGWSPDEGQTL